MADLGSSGLSSFSFSSQLLGICSGSDTALLPLGSQNPQRFLCTLKKFCSNSSFLIRPLSSNVQFLWSGDALLMCVHGGDYGRQ